jgi:hypothetical protein
MVAHRSTGAEMTEESTTSEFRNDDVSPAFNASFSVALDDAARSSRAALRSVVSSTYG